MNSLLFPRPVNPHYKADDPRLAWVMSNGESVPVLVLKPEEKHQGDDAFVVLFSHGNAQDIGSTEKYGQMMVSALSVTVVLYDYAGYGHATGEPSEAQVFSDARAVYDYVVREMRVDPSRIILHGFSIGCAPTLDLASKVQARGVVLMSPLLSAVLTRCHPLLSFCTCPFDPFSSMGKLGDVKQYTHIIHGCRDTLVPAWHGKYIHDKLENSFEPLWVEQAGHNNIDRQVAFASMAQFLFFLKDAPLVLGGKQEAPPTEAPAVGFPWRLWTRARAMAKRLSGYNSK